MTYTMTYLIIGAITTYGLRDMLRDQMCQSMTKYSMSDDPRKIFPALCVLTTIAWPAPLFELVFLHK